MVKSVGMGHFYESLDPSKAYLGSAVTPLFISAFERWSCIADLFTHMGCGLMADDVYD